MNGIRFDYSNDIEFRLTLLRVILPLLLEEENGNDYYYRDL